MENGRWALDWGIKYNKEGVLGPGGGRGPRAYLMITRSYYDLL